MSDDIHGILDTLSPHVRWYILEGETPVRATLREWGAWRKKNKVHVDETIKNGMRVSTVFLGLDHGHYFDGKDHPPILFETMVFREDKSSRFGWITDTGDYGGRCATFGQAKQMHAATVRKVFGPPLKIVGGSES